MAFVQLLYTLHSDVQARGIVISLGEDEDATFKYLEKIDREQGFTKAYPETPIVTLRESGRLEVAYYPPGFITPEEFFHRIQLIIARHRNERKDQLHPL